jgi:hypothetical protein
MIGRCAISLLPMMQFLCTNVGGMSERFSWKLR